MPQRDTEGNVPESVLVLDGSAFERALGEHLDAKQSGGARLSAVEAEAWLLFRMLPAIEKDGFVDLFYQTYTLSECMLVPTTLRKIGLERAADLFDEALSIYTGANTRLTEQEFRSIDPFQKGESWSRFDAIGDELMGEKSELYSIGARVERYLKA